jgi:hypothetical protein
MASNSDLEQRNPRVEMSAYEHHASKIPAPEARQGAVLGHVRYVLGFGLALVIVAFAIIYFLHV